MAQVLVLDVELGLGYRMSSVGSRGQGLEFCLKEWVSGFIVEGLVCGVEGLRCDVLGFGFGLLG